MVSQEARNSIIRFNPQPPQSYRGSFHAGAELGPGDFAVGGFGRGNYCDVGGTNAGRGWVEEVFGEVEEGVGEEVRPGEHGCSGR